MTLYIVLAQLVVTSWGLGLHQTGRLSRAGYRVWIGAVWALAAAFVFVVARGWRR